MSLERRNLGRREASPDCNEPWNKCGAEEAWYINHELEAEPFMPRKSWRDARSSLVFRRVAAHSSCTRRQDFDRPPLLPSRADLAVDDVQEDSVAQDYGTIEARRAAPRRVMDDRKPRGCPAAVREECE
jgi:hypothetical protein